MSFRRAYGRRFRELIDLLSRYESLHGPLPGLIEEEARATFIEQIIDSEQRDSYFDFLSNRQLDWSSADPGDDRFDPLKAALLQNSVGNYDEAVWLAYLFVHFGRHRTGGWRYVRDIYGRLGQGELWDWSAISADTTLFRFWLQDSQGDLVRPGPRGFGNHRKYESLNAWEPTGTGEAVSSYVNWVMDDFGSHTARFAEALSLGPEAGFSQLFESMREVRRFGRIAKFDYLNTLRRLGLLDVRAPHTYLVGATGPLRGARLLLDDPGSSMSARVAQDQLSELSSITGIAADVLEDAVCNWQKSPMNYVRFSG